MSIYRDILYTISDPVTTDILSRWYIGLPINVFENENARYIKIRISRRERIIIHVLKVIEKGDCIDCDRRFYRLPTSCVHTYQVKEVYNY